MLGRHRLWLENVVTRVALGTDIFYAIGIELRGNIHKVGEKMIYRSLYGPAYDRSQFYCKEVAGIKLAFTPPFADARIVFWNNILFEPRVVEFAKDQLCKLFVIRLLLSCMNLCPRHRPHCTNDFCTYFLVDEELEIPCSWKDGLQRV
ncbi:S-adenosyl-L-methionine-dependent methyltransferase [Phytophthora cactorum]|nr:S-adenosyl-L-methionine-dependent methyltransferase [Phytophthora cactorum]